MAKFLIELEVDGDPDDAQQALKLALDAGVLQDEINGYDTEDRPELEVTSVTSKFVEE